MFGGSVRDRIRAAEALQGDGKSQPSGSRRGYKLALKTDEHIKEEYLRRGDGGWSKNVDIGQQEAYVPQPNVPFIKVTLETPVVESKDPRLPGKLSKSASDAFESISEDKEGEASSSVPLEKTTASKDEPSTQKGAEKDTKTNAPSKDDSAVPSIDPSKRECEPEYAEDTMPTRSQSGGHRRRSKSRQAHVEDFDDSLEEVHHHAQDYDSVEFHVVDWDGSHAPSRASSRRRQRPSSTREERFVRGETVVHDAPRSRSRSSRSKSATREHQHDHRHYHHHHHDDRSETPATPRIRKSSSRSGSTYRDSSETRTSPPTSARRSSNLLWPSFSNSERRSLGDVFEASSTRSKSPRPRPRSFHSTSSLRTEASSKTLELAEYFAGQKLDYLPQAPPSPQPKNRPLGFVRAMSSTGEYTEYYTRDKTLLRKPDEDEFLEPTHEHRVRRERHSFHGGLERKKDHDRPWQVKLLQGIAKH